MGSSSPRLMLAWTLALGGCVGVGPNSGGPNVSAATWQIPWQLTPATAASQGREGQSVVAFVPQTGVVRATPAVMASIGRPLQAAPGPNRTVAACRDTVQSEATKFGARDVEAVSAGRERRDGQGRYVAPVHFRITYARDGGYEVRDGTLTCIVDRNGKIVDAHA